MGVIGHKDIIAPDLLDAYTAAQRGAPVFVAYPVGICQVLVVGNTREFYLDRYLVPFGLILDFGGQALAKFGQFLNIQLGCFPAVAVKDLALGGFSKLESGFPAELSRVEG